MAKVKTIKGLEKKVNVEYYTLKNNILPQFINRLHIQLEKLDYIQTSKKSLSNEKENLINEEKQNLYISILKLLTHQGKRQIVDSYAEIISGNQDILACFTDNEGFHLYHINRQNDKVTFLHTVESNILFSQKINTYPSASNSKISSYGDHLSYIEDDSSAENKRKADKGKQTGKSLIELTENEITLLFRLLKSPLARKEPNNNIRTIDVYNNYLVETYTNNIFNKVITKENHNNLETCEIKNKENETGLVIAFKHIQNQASQIIIPETENKFFSGLMSIERQDKDGKELGIYDILRIKEGKVIDIVSADPNPTLENSRVAEIYEQLSKEQALTKSTKSFVNGIIASNSNKEQHPGRS